MRRFAACLAAFLCVAPAVAAPRDFARDLVMRRLSSQTFQRKVITASAARRRTVQPPANSACPTMVVAQAVVANWLALSGDNLFVSESTVGIFRIAKDGLTPRTQIVSRIGEDILQLVVDDTDIYFISIDDDTTGSIYRAPRDGGTPMQLATKLLAPVDLTIDSTSIYWVNLGTILGESVAADGSVERMLKNGTERQVLAEKLSAPLSLVLDGNDLFFTESGLALGNTNAGVRRLPKTGGALTKLVESFLTIAVAASGSDVFYSNFSEDTPSIVRIAKSGGNSQTLIADMLGLSLTVRDAKLYTAAINEEGSTVILTVPTSGGSVRIVRAAELDTQALALDECAVYYAAELRLERAPR